mgnify:CR=1 FL=1
MIGASGGIGAALIKQLTLDAPEANVFAFSRRQLTEKPNSVKASEIELENETSISGAAGLCRQHVKDLSAVFVATGLLHDGESVKPEKSWRSMNAYSLEQAFRINTIGPALVAKHFLPLMKRDSKSVFACLSARVGSIEQNQLGGWYGYRASKTAVNMVGTNLKYELEPRGISIVLLHPGMVATEMTGGRGISPSDSASGLIERIDELSMESSGTFMHAEGYQLPW